MRMSTLLEEVRKKEEGFASDAQRRAAFAQGYKAKGKKDKKEELGKEDEPKVKKIIGKLKKASDAHAGQAKDLQKAMNEDGHTDVSSAIRQCKTMIEDAMQITSKLQTMNPEESLPSWWTNKLAIASNNMNKLRDYFLVPVTEETLVEKDIKILVKDVKDRNFLKDLMNKAKDEKVMVGSPTPADRRAGKYVFVGPKDKVNNVFNYAFDKSINRGNYAPATMMHEETLNEFNPNRESLILVDKDRKIVGMYDGNNAEKEARSAMRSAHLPPMSIPKSEVSKMRIIRLNKIGRTKGIGDKVDKLAVGIDEMAYKPGSFKDTKAQERGAKALADLAKTGGLDKKDYEKARSLYVQASDPASREKLKKFIFNLDTEPKEEIMDKIGRNDPETFLQMYPNAKRGQPLTTVSFAHRSMKSEEAELDEMNMKQIHKDIKDGMGNIRHRMTMKGKKHLIYVAKDDEKDAQAAMKNHPEYVAGRLRVIPEQTDADEGDANIMMQLRKAVSLRGMKDVKFGDGKSTKVKAPIAQKALDMFNRMKPYQKMQFQQQIVKSYSDLLNAIKGR